MPRLSPLDLLLAVLCAMLCALLSLLAWTFAPPFIHAALSVLLLAVWFRPAVRLVEVAALQLGVRALEDRELVQRVRIWRVQPFAGRYGAALLAVCLSLGTDLLRALVAGHDLSRPFVQVTIETALFSAFFAWMRGRSGSQGPEHIATQKSNGI